MPLALSRPVRSQKFSNVNFFYLKSLSDKVKPRASCFKLQPPAPSGRIEEESTYFRNVAQGGWDEGETVWVGPVIEFKTGGPRLLVGPLSCAVL